MSPDQPRRRRRLLVLAVAAAAALLGGAGFRYLFLSRPVGEGPAGPGVPAEPFSRTWDDRPVVLLALQR